MFDYKKGRAAVGAIFFTTKWPCHSKRTGTIFAISVVALESSSPQYLDISIIPSVIRSYLFKWWKIDQLTFEQLWWGFPNFWFYYPLALSKKTTTSPSTCIICPSSGINCVMICTAHTFIDHFIWVRKQIGAAIYNARRLSVSFFFLQVRSVATASIFVAMYVDVCGGVTIDGGAGVSGIPS